MIFLTIPVFMLWFSWHVADAADGVVEPHEETRDLFDVKIQALPASPYIQNNQ